FNHSIALAITNKSGVLQARYIVLITILVIARKEILGEPAQTNSPRPRSLPRRAHHLASAYGASRVTGSSQIFRPGSMSVKLFDR
ncbi:MAG: hypothetical protein ACLQU5_05890, partial [Isosphaeraceae bacterium]